MISLACLVMPVDLAATALGGQDDHGWLLGTESGAERVFVILGLGSTTGEPIITAALDRLAEHRSVWSGKYETRLPWAIMEQGFHRALRLGLVDGVRRLNLWRRGDAALPEVLQGHHYLCCLEPGDDGPIINFVLVLADPDDPTERVYPLDVEPVATAPLSLPRQDGLVPLEQLRGKRVAIVGLGSGGGVVAVELAAAGVGHLHLVDRDRLRAVNLFRHVCGREDLGRTKVAAVADLIRDHELPVDVHTYPVDILFATDQLRAIVAEVDLVLGATDTVPSRRLLNYLCVRADTPLILASTFDNARIGEVIRVLPGRTACYECARLHLQDWGSLAPDPDGGDSDAVPYAAQEMEVGAAPSPGTRTDVHSVAALQAKVAVMTLLDDEPGAFEPLPRDYFTWGAVRNLRFPPPFAFQYPFATNYVTLVRRPDCPVCGVPPAELQAMDIEQAYATVMAAAAGEVGDG